MVMSRELFILSLFVITATGIAGYLLYKYGTGMLGTITFDRMAEINLTSNSMFYLAIMILGFIMVAYAGVT